MRWLWSAALLVCLASPASAGSTTVTGKDAAGVTHNWVVITDGSGNFVWEHGICDGTAAAQCSAVKAASTAAAQTDPALVTRNPDLGTISDAAYSGSGNATVIAALKGVYASVTSPEASSGTTTNAAKLVTTGLTYQTLLNPGTRKALILQNNQISGTDVCYLLYGTNIDSQIVPGTTTTSTNFTIGGGTISAGAASLILNPGQPYTRLYPINPSDTFYFTCSTTGDSLYADFQ